jgi:hypothetical protein
VSIERKTPKGVFLFHIVSIYYKKHIMKIIKLTESDLQKIVKRVINEQVLSDYKKIQDYLDSLIEKPTDKSSTGNIIKYEFENADGLGVVELENNGKVNVYLLKGGIKKFLGNPKTVEALERILAAEN